MSAARDPESAPNTELDPSSGPGAGASGLVFGDPLDGPSSDDTGPGWGDPVSGAGDDDFTRFLNEKPPHHL